MKIYLSRRTAGGGGGGLKGNLSYMDAIIQKALDNVSFKSSFEELWLTLYYPPIYAMPVVVDIEADFLTYYNKLPYSFINRRYKKIDVALKAPEFSKHLDNSGQYQYEQTFDVDERYKNIPEIELATILIDKYIEAGATINSKIKKSDTFNFEQYKTALTALQQKITPEYLKFASQIAATEIVAKSLKRAVDARDQRKQTDKVKDKLIRDLRVYDSGLPLGTLYPYDYIYTAIFLNILREKRLMCPGYNHLFIMVGKTMEDCLRNSLTLESWSINGLAVIDYDDYLRQTEQEKEQTVFNLIINGIMDIVDIDKLDRSIVESTIEKIKQKGMDTELEYLTVENTNYKLTVSYLSRTMEEECPIYFTLSDKSSKMVKKSLIGRAENSQIYLWLQKITLTNTQIKIKSSSSITADVWLKNKPRNMEFNIRDFLNG